MRALLLLGFAGLTALAGGCRTPDGATAVPVRFDSMDDYQNRRATAMDRLTDAVGEARATDVSACRALAVGAKACGGPTAYVVFSSTATDAAEAERLAGDVTALDRAANLQFGLVSTCEMLLEPAVALDAGRCVAAPPGR